MSSIIGSSRATAVSGITFLNPQNVIWRNTKEVSQQNRKEKKKAREEIHTKTTLSVRKSELQKDDFTNII